MESQEIPTSLPDVQQGQETRRAVPETVAQMRERLSRKEGITPEQLVQGVYEMNVTFVNERGGGLPLAIDLLTNYAMGATVATRLQDPVLRAGFATRIASIEDQLIAMGEPLPPTRKEPLGFVPNPPPSAK